MSLYKSKALRRFQIKQLVTLHDRKLIKKKNLVLGKTTFEVKNLSTEGNKFYIVFKPVHLSQPSSPKDIETQIKNNLETFTIKFDLFTTAVILVVFIFLYCLINNLLNTYITDSSFLNRLSPSTINSVSKLITEVLVFNEKNTLSCESYKIKFKLLNELTKSIL